MKNLVFNCVMNKIFDLKLRFKQIILNTSKYGSLPIFSIRYLNFNDACV